MELFNLPKQTLVNKSIPKNAFDKYTNSKQKKLFVDLIDKIVWLNKLSSDTINLSGKEINEIQIFEIKLRKKDKIETLLDLIDKSIPYHIIFFLTFENEMMLSVSKKHPHPTNEDNSVIDWTFKTEWGNIKLNKYQINLKESIDFILVDFCNQLTGKQENQKQPIKDLIQQEQKIKTLKNIIERLELKIKKCKQFNKKLELNLEMQKRILELKEVQVN